MNEEVVLLSPPTNYAVVQLRERRFPGIVVQGDSFHGLLSQVRRMGELVDANDLSELRDEINDLKEQLSDTLQHYEKVCRDRGLALPY